MADAFADAEVVPDAELSIRFICSPRRLSCAAQACTAFFEMHGPDEETVSDISLALVEAMNNIQKHAYTGAGGVVEISIALIRTSYLVKVVDYGSPMPDEPSLPRPLPSSTMDIEDLPEGGFGLDLIVSVCDSAHYERLGNRNELTLTRGLASRGKHPRLSA